MREAGGARESFPRKLEHDRRAEIECGQTVDEQRIVSVSGLPNNWPQNSTQLYDVCFHVSARHALRDGLSGVRVAFVCESGTKKNLEFARRASAASAPITQHAYRHVGEHLLANGFRNQIQQLANVQKRKWPGTIIGYDPAISIEIEFPLEPARRAMKPSQIQRGLFEDSGCQISPARFELVIVGSVHVVMT